MSDLRDKLSALAKRAALVWTEDCCAGCGRPAYERRDGRSYLYDYGNGKPCCHPRCAEKLERLN